MDLCIPRRWAVLLVLLSMLMMAAYSAVLMSGGGQCPTGPAIAGYVPTESDGTPTE